jgi:hypothetical protein
MPMPAHTACAATPAADGAAKGIGGLVVSGENLFIIALNHKEFYSNYEGYIPI